MGRACCVLLLEVRPLIVCSLAGFWTWREDSSYPSPEPSLAGAVTLPNQLGLVGGFWLNSSSLRTAAFGLNTWLAVVRLPLFPFFLVPTACSTSQLFYLLC